MKSAITTRKKLNAAALMFSLILTAGSINAQGLLIEGAAKLIKSVKHELPENGRIFQHAKFNPSMEDNNISVSFASISESQNVVRKSFRNEFGRSSNRIDSRIMQSFTVDNVNIIYEGELHSEEWMTESFAENLETVPVVEGWMTESFAENLEPTPSLEDWMKEPFSENLESVIEAEDWMTVSFADNLESAIVTEEWMTESLYEGFEPGLEVENWMLVPLTINGAQEESPLAAEGWMSELFYK